VMSCMSFVSTKAEIAEAVVSEPSKMRFTCVASVPRASA
jgi:hypothetical protein